MAANWTKEMASASFTFRVLESFKQVLIPFQGDVLDNKEKTTREKNKFFIPEKAFEKCNKKLKEWANLKGCDKQQGNEKLGSQKL